MVPYHTIAYADAGDLYDEARESGMYYPVLLRCRAESKLDESSPTRATILPRPASYSSSQLDKMTTRHI